MASTVIKWHHYAFTYTLAMHTIILSDPGRLNNGFAWFAPSCRAQHQLLTAVFVKGIDVLAVSKTQRTAMAGV